MAKCKVLGCKREAVGGEHCEACEERIQKMLGKLKLNDRRS